MSRSVGKSKQELVSMSPSIAIGAAVSTLGCYVEFSVEIPAEISPPPMLEVVNPASVLMCAA